MQRSFISLLLGLVLLNCSGQESAAQLIGGPCQGCEAIYEYGNRTLTSIDTLPDFNHSHPKLKITGTVYQKDGNTPAENIILYIYHTNLEGIYPKKGNEKGWAQTHGYIRGWVKTGKDGRYTFYTFRPAPYPVITEPEHIHIIVKEPNKNEYYIDNYIFADAPLLTDSFRKKLRNRGGSGIVQAIRQEDLLVIKRDLILGLNIPNYVTGQN